AARRQRLAADVGNDLQITGPTHRVESRADGVVDIAGAVRIRPWAGIVFGADGDGRGPCRANTGEQGGDAAARLAAHYPIRVAALCGGRFDRAVDDRLRFLQDALQVFGPAKAFGVDLVDVLGA